MIVIDCDCQVKKINNSLVNSQSADGQPICRWVSNLQLGIHSVNSQMGQVNLQMGQIYRKVGTYISREFSIEHPSVGLASLAQLFCALFDKSM